MQTQKIFIAIAAFLGALSVALGAYAAHVLPNMTTRGVIDMFQIGVKYQLLHTFALLAVGILFTGYKGKVLTLSGIFFVLGILFFSGSIYLLTFLNIKVIPPSYFLRMVTPSGGFCLIIGWLLLGVAVLLPRSNRK